MIELSIRVSNSEHSYIHKILCSHDLLLSKADVVLSEWIEEAVQKFNALSPDETVDDVVIKTKMDW